MSPHTSNGDAGSNGQAIPARPATIIRIAKHTRHYVTLD